MSEVTRILSAIAQGDSAAAGGSLYFLRRSCEC
jgi:hypothetical protein